MVDVNEYVSVHGPELDNYEIGYSGIDSDIFGPSCENLSDVVEPSSWSEGSDVNIKGCQAEDARKPILDHADRSELTAATTSGSSRVGRAFVARVRAQVVDNAGKLVDIPMVFIRRDGSSSPIKVASLTVVPTFRSSAATGRRVEA